MIIIYEQILFLSDVKIRTKKGIHRNAGKGASKKT